MRKFSPPFSSLLTHKISSTVYPKSQPPSSSSVSHRKCSSGFHRRNSHRPSDRGSSSRTRLPRFFDMTERETVGSKYHVVFRFPDATIATLSPRVSTPSTPSHDVHPVSGDAKSEQSQIRTVSNSCYQISAL